jgi:hypothetical protein
MGCPVCFGSVDATVRESVNAGILVLLVTTAGVLGGFVRFFISLARRSRDA